MCVINFPGLQDRFTAPDWEQDGVFAPVCIVLSTHYGIDWQDWTLKTDNKYTNLQNKFQDMIDKQLSQAFNDPTRSKNTPNLGYHLKI